MNFIDVLKDPLLPWSVGEPGVQDMLQLDSFSGIHVTSLLQEPTFSQYSDLNSQDCSEMLDSDLTSASQGHDTKLCVRATENKENVQQNGIDKSPLLVKIETQEGYSYSSPELLKLLKNHPNANVLNQQHAVKNTVSEAQLQNVQSTMNAPDLLPVQAIQFRPAQVPPQQILPTQQTVPVQPIPIQPIPSQRPKIMISPQPTSLQLYSILPNQKEAPRYPVVTLPR